MSIEILKGEKYRMAKVEGYVVPEEGNTHWGFTAKQFTVNGEYVTQWFYRQDGTWAGGSRKYDIVGLYDDHGDLGVES